MRAKHLIIISALIITGIAPKNCTRISESIIDKFGILFNQEMSLTLNLRGRVKRSQIFLLDKQ